MAIGDIEARHLDRRYAVPSSDVDSDFQPYNAAVAAQSLILVSLRRGVAAIASLPVRQHALSLRRSDKGVHRHHRQHLIRVGISQDIGERLVGVDRLIIAVNNHAEGQVLDETAESILGGRFVFC